jgi:hypothetical protein
VARMSVGERMGRSVIIVAAAAAALDRSGTVGRVAYYVGQTESLL